MKVFYTDIKKKSERTNLGFKLLKISLILFLLFLITLIGGTSIFERGSLEIKISFNISMVIMVLFLITFTLGIIIARKKITGEEDLRVFVYNNNELYVIDKDGVPDGNFSAFQASLYGGGDALSLVIAGLSMLTYSMEKKEKIEISRDKETIIKELKNHTHNVIKNIKVLKDNNVSMEIIITTLDGSRRKLIIANNYNDYEELFNIIRKIGGKNEIWI